MTVQKSSHIDYPLAIAVAVLLVLGISLLASVSAIFSQEKFGETTYYLSHQIICGLLLGIFLGFIAFKIPLSWIRSSALPLVLLNLILMIFVFIPGIGIVSGGAPRWLNLGIASIQPSEFLKLSFILYLSAWLARPRAIMGTFGAGARQAKKNPRIKNRAGFTPLENRITKQKNKADKSLAIFTLIPFIIVIGIVALLLICQSDISTLGVIICVALLMYFSTTTPLWHIILMILIFSGGMLALIEFASYRTKRVLVFLGIKSDPMGMGYQIKQALIAVGSGGIFGLGLGASKQIDFIPQTMSDSIFAIYAEETGFIGSLFLIFLFLFFLWRAFKIANNSSDKFSRLLAIGISSWICIQAFVNIGSTVGILPLTGIPLPFIGYGGSHLVVELIAVGILLNISKNSKK